MLAQKFKEHLGTPEYTGIVATIQKWFYGSLVKASWCATSLSYFMNDLGQLSIIGGKNENVYAMMNACKKFAEDHPDDVQFFTKEEIPDQLLEDDILFWLWSGKMCVTGDKHVGVCSEDTVSPWVPCIGGNQKDMICVQEYPKDCLYAVYRWKHSANLTPGWKHLHLAWKYVKEDLTYAVSEWQKINHHWYYFADNGFMVTGLQTLPNGQTCYFTEEGPYEGALQATDPDGYLHIWEVD